ncbi:MAG: hypothetical protein LBT94_10160, partial [Prevotellaceae bacterium]|nr:hypothetical protein [Prevotellaceae bacterium]
MLTNSSELVKIKKPFCSNSIKILLTEFSFPVGKLHVHRKKIGMIIGITKFIKYHETNELNIFSIGGKRKGVKLFHNLNLIRISRFHFSWSKQPNSHFSLTL